MRYLVLSGLITILGSYYQPNLYVVAFILLFTFFPWNSEVARFRYYYSLSFFSNYYVLLQFIILTVFLEEVTNTKQYLSFVAYEFVSVQMFCMNFQGWYALPWSILVQSCMNNVCGGVVVRAIVDNFAYMNKTWWEMAIEKLFCHAIMLVVNKLN